MSEMKRNKRKMLDSGPKRRIMKAPEGMAIPKHQHKKQRLTAQQKRDLTKKRRTPKFDEAKEEEEEDIIAAQELLEGGFSENEMDDSGVSEESEGEAADNKNGDELKGKATMSVETPSTADIDANVRVESLSALQAEDDADFPMDDDMGVEAAKDDKKPVKLDQNEKVAGAGLANVMSKILHPDIADADDGPILAKDNQVKRKIEETSKEEKSRKLTALEKKERKEKGHVDASKSSRMYERKLQKVATRGLVKLFNTIRKQQQELDANLDGVAEGKKKKVINETLDKAKFIDMLKTKTISKETQLAARLTGDGAESAGATTQPNARQNGVDWLSTDYLMTHKMKHFDRETTDLEVVDDGGHEEVNSDEE